MNDLVGMQKQNWGRLIDRIGFVVSALLCFSLDTTFAEISANRVGQESVNSFQHLDAVVSIGNTASCMNELDILKEVIEDNRTVRLVEEDIYSVLPDVQQTYQYDKKAAIYDFVVGSSLYNRVMWGDSPNNYMAFARRAINSHPNGWLMEAGCGSMLFTAEAYLQCRRPIIACDQSLDMLRRARARLSKSANSVPEHIFLVQADVSDIPFRPVSFQTVLSMNVLHHYADVVGLVLKLKYLLTESGCIYLTSLVTNNRFPGDHYLNALHNKGWLAQPRIKDELKKLLRESLGTEMRFWTEGNMAYATTDILSSYNLTL